MEINIWKLSLIHNISPKKVFKFYCTTSKTYLRKNQLTEIRDVSLFGVVLIIINLFNTASQGTLFLRRSSYREEDDDDDANEKKKLVVFEKVRNHGASYIKGITKEKLVQRLLRPMMGENKCLGFHKVNMPSDL